MQIVFLFFFALLKCGSRIRDYISSTCAFLVSLYVQYYAFDIKIQVSHPPEKNKYK